jgi:hypothetical protein
MPTLKIKDFQKDDALVHDFLTNFKTFTMKFAPILINENGDERKPTAKEIPKVISVYNRYQKLNNDNVESFELNGIIKNKYKYNTTSKYIEVDVDYNALDPDYYEHALETLMCPDSDGNYSISEDYLIGMPHVLEMYVKDKMKVEKKPLAPRVSPKVNPKETISKSKSKKTKINNDKILNPATGRMVLKSGKIGQALLKK